MQVQWFPQSVCLQVDRSVRNFLWKGHNETGMHMVGWSKITQTKKHGGLGVRVTRHNNTAMLGKLIWDVTAAPDKLWVRLMKDKYFPNHTFLGAPTRRGSSTWTSMVKARDSIGTGFTFKFGNGESNFWNDSWLFPSPLGPQLDSVHIHDTHLKLKDVYAGGNWNLDMLHTIIPQEWKDAMHALTPMLAESVPDAWIWSHTSTGIYSVKSAYQLLLEGNTATIHPQNWNWLWQLKIPANVQFFLWQFCHNSLPTKSVLHHRNVLDSSLCTICHSHEETIHHCLFACTHAREVWHICTPLGFSHPDSDFNPDIWLKDSISGSSELVTIIMWKIWCARNVFLFERKPFRPIEVSNQIVGLWADVIAAYGSRTAAVRCSSGLEVSWQHPPPGWIALSVDGSAQLAPPAASFGGLLRDHDGRFISGFYGSLGESTIMHAELRALLHGLELCWEMGFRNIVCYTDSLNTLRLVDSAQVRFHVHGNEVELVRGLLARPWIVRLQHVYREANFCADYLAKLGMSSQLPRVQIDTPPAGLTQLLYADAQGLPFIRP